MRQNITELGELSMDADDLIKITLGNARSVAKGNYTGLLCPKCRNRSVEAYFSAHNLKRGYGIWFECQFCRNVEHISCELQPAGFTPLRVSEKYQKLDEQAWDAEQ